MTEADQYFSLQHMVLTAEHRWLYLSCLITVNEVGEPIIWPHPNINIPVYTSVYCFNTFASYLSIEFDPFSADRTFEFQPPPKLPGLFGPEFWDFVNKWYVEFSTSVKQVEYTLQSHLVVLRPYIIKKICLSIAVWSRILHREQTWKSWCSYLAVFSLPTFL